MILRTIVFMGVVTNKHHWRPPSQGVKSWGPHPTQGRWVWAAALELQKRMLAPKPCSGHGLKQLTTWLQTLRTTTKWWSCIQKNRTWTKRRSWTFCVSQLFQTLSNATKNISWVLRFGTSQKIPRYPKNRLFEALSMTVAGILTGAELGLRPYRSRSSSWANVWLALLGLGWNHGWVADHLHVYIYIYIYMALKIMFLMIKAHGC